MNRQNREEFSEYMKDCGIDSDDPKTMFDKAALPVAYGAWQAQQLVIDELKYRIAKFKNAFNDL